MAATGEAAGLMPIGIDGKAVRRPDRTLPAGRLQLASARAAANRLTPGQTAVPDLAS